MEERKKIYYSLLRNRFFITALALGLVLAISGLSALKLSPQADDLEDEIEKLLTPRATFAAACPPPQDGIECDGTANKNVTVFYDSVLAPIISGSLEDSAVDCVTDEKTFKIIAPTKLGQSATRERVSCSFTVSAANRSKTKYNVFVTTNISIPNATFLTGLGSPTQQNNGTQSVNINGQILGKVKLFLDGRDGFWSVEGKSIEQFLKVDINSPFTLLMSDNEDLYVESSSDITIDRDKSFWRLSTRGSVSGHIAYHFDPNPGKGWEFTRLDFCPQQCQVSLIEIQHIEAKKKGIINGDLFVDARHEETYQGTGIGDPKTGKVKWNTDVQVKKFDDRSWSFKLKEGTRESWTYSGKSKASADIMPFQSKSTIESTLTKDLTYAIKQATAQNSIPGAFAQTTIPSTSPTGSITPSPRPTPTRSPSPRPTSTPTATPPPGPIPTPPGQITPNPSTTPSSPADITGRIHVDITETKQNTPFNRTGTGKREIVPNENISGVFDTIDELMRITSPPDRSGQRIDPFADISPKYLQMYFTDFQVPGQFTGGSNNADGTVMSTRPVKTLPKNIVVFMSFARGDKAFPADDISLVMKVLEAAKKRGSNITIIDTSSKQKMLKGLKQLKNGDWLINFGHGSPNGLGAGNEDVPYWLIRRHLDSRQVKLSLFGAASCYSSRASIAETIVGAAGVSTLTTPPSGGLNTLVGVGTNSLNTSSEDLAHILAQYLGCKSGP